MGILSGLDQFGLGNLENVDVYAEEKKKAEKAAEEPPEIKESDLIFDKTHTCPVCDKEFKVKTVKIGKAKLIGTDLDLRPKYENIDTLKYDIILCPHCGYATLSRYFKFITTPQAKLIKAHISKNYKNPNIKSDIYTYDDAIERYKLALANAIVKRSRSSEKAYICLKMAWVVRGKLEHLNQSAPDYAAKKKECEDEENELLHNSMEGFLAARQSETYPMCGMDEATVDYLIAVMSMRFEQYDVSAKLISGILQSSATPRMKDKTRDLKDILLAKMKKAK